jgi:protein involved in polysaccharide export with SLBB domain
MYVLLLLCLAVLQPHVGAAQEAAPAPEVGPETVTLQPGDVLRIQIWREPDLSGTFLIDETGRVTIPLLGEKHVLGLPLHRVRDMLLEEYRVQLRNPSIEITPLRRIHVLGEVNRAGLLEVDPTVSLATVVTMAGGATPAGDLNRIRLIRGDTVIHSRLAATDALSRLDLRSGDQIIVDRRNWFERNSAFLISVGLSVPSVIASIIVLLRQ